MERTRKLPSVVSVGSSSTSPRVASVTSSAPPSRNSCFSSSAEAAVSSSSVLPVSRVASQRLVCLGNGPAGGLAGPHGLGHAGRAHRAGQRGLRPAAVQQRELHRRVHHGRGRLGRSLLRSAHSRHRRRGHAVVHGGRVRQLAEHHGRGQRGPVELRHRNHGQHTHHQQHGQRRELHHGGRRVHGRSDGGRAPR